MRYYWLFLSWLSVLLVMSPAEAARLLFWRFDPNQNQLIFSTDIGVQPSAQLISNPTRLVIDLPGIVLGRPTVNQTLGGTIRSMRVGQFDDRTTRIVIELAPGYTIDPEAIKFRGASPTNWSVDLPTPERIAQPRSDRRFSQKPSEEESSVSAASLAQLAQVEAIEERGDRLVVRADSPLNATSRWNDRAGVYEITLANAQLAESVEGPQLKPNSSIEELRIRQQDAQTVVLLLRPARGFHLENIRQRGTRVNINLKR